MSTNQSCRVWAETNRPIVPTRWRSPKSAAIASRIGAQASACKDIKPPTPAEMRRLTALMKKPVDTSDIPEWTRQQFRDAVKRRNVRLRAKGRGKVA